MQAEKLYHKCGYPILVVKKAVGPASTTFFVDGNNPFIEGKDGDRKTRIVTSCPECKGFIKMERLLSNKPDQDGEKKASGYIPARI